MLAWPPSRFIALFLGLWVVLAPAIFAIPAAAMAAQTSMSDDTGSGGCDGCPQGDADRSVCALMCLNLALFAITAESSELPTELGSGHDPGRYPTLLGRVSTPDTAPPKPVSLP